MISPRLILAGLLTCSLLPMAAHAQSDGEPRGWRFRPIVRAEAEYDHNIYRLSDGRRGSPGSPSAEEVRSGRYENMESGFDVVGSVDASVRMRRPGIGGRNFALRPVVGAIAHALNPALNGVWFGASAAQEFGRGREVNAAMRFEPETFRRNYLSGVVDEDGNGIITEGERRYSAGRASALQFDAEYRHRLRKAGGATPGVWLEAGAGYEQRRYAAPLAGRDLAGPHASVRLRSSVGPLSLGLGYNHARLGASPSQEVMLVRDGLARRAVVGMVDRSRTENAVRAGVGVKPTRRTHLDVDLEQRARTFTSDQPTDAIYRGRSATRRSVAVELGRSRGRLDSFARLQYASQLLRRGEESGDADDYTRLRGGVGLRVTF